MGLALGPPLDRLAEESATMHMVQHVILLDFVPILLFAGLTKALLRPVTRRIHGVEDRLGVLAMPVFAVVLYCGLMFAWHVPGLYDSALRNSFVHTIEHISLMSAGLLYWWHLMGPVRQRLRFGGMGPVLYMASTKAVVAMLGIVLIFSPRSLYAYRGSFLGMDPLTDQHVAGLVMATEQTVVMGIAFAVLFLKMLADSERRQLRAEAIADSRGAGDAGGP
jgi:cytochrome c oxidase assembly factor CtaG